MFLSTITRGATCLKISDKFPEGFHTIVGLDCLFFLTFSFLFCFFLFGNMNFWHENVKHSELTNTTVL